MKKIKSRINQFVILIKYKYYYLYCKIKKIDNSNVWLISERGIDARDNGFVFYSYLKKKHPSIETHYVISKSSPDFEKVKLLGEPIIYGSREHFIYFITSGLLISTHLMGFSPNMGLFCYLNRKKRLNIKGKFISLSHGIKNAYHPKLNYKETKLDLIFLGGKKEIKTFKDNTDFGDRIKGCGLARYDNLISNPKRIILVMPTFRMWMKYYNDKEFMKTEYYNKYNSLLNNNRLIKLLSDYNYTLIFYPHIEFQKFLSCFTSNNSHIILGDISKFDVQKLLINSELLITDYSSVFFDFAYMRKPVIYYQFDYEEYRQKHYQAGYFKYSTDGFGPIVKNEENLIDEIETNILNSFEFKDVYESRINDFFAFNDRNNCNRIYNEINKLIKDEVYEK